MLNKPHTF